MSPTVAEPAVSVVIPAHDAAATLGAQLDALLGQRGAPPFEVVVADDASTDGTAALVEAYAARDARVRRVPHAGRRGPSAARNTGMRAARAAIVACCDADDVVGDGWLAAMTAALATHRFVGGVLEVERLNDPVVVAARGASVPGRLGDLHGVAFAHGCNLGVDRTLFLAAGGFDESLRTGEEIDLAVRLAARGVRAHEVAAAVVHYRYRADALALRRQAFAHGRVHPYLARQLRRYGLARPSRLAGARAWLWLARNAVRHRHDAAARLRWQWTLANRCGRLAGCWRHRTVYL